jgi:hypothetical protein
MCTGEILDMMRRNGAKDLEVSFAAMRFIVQSALTIIDDAVKDTINPDSKLLLVNPTLEGTSPE